MNENLGKVSKEADGFQVKFERVLNHDILTVWDALTNPEKLRLWFTDFEMEYREGGKITITYRDEQKTVTHGEVVHIDAPKRFEYTWEEELAVWQLYPLGVNQCKLTLTFSKVSDKCAIGAPAGFHILLNRLRDMLNGDQQTYPFGSEENDPDHLRMEELYIANIHNNQPELERFTPLVIERTFNTPIEVVWQAITDKDQMKEWYFELKEFSPEVGFEFQFPGTGHNGEEYIHLCKVTEVDPPCKLQYSWKYKGYQGISFVTFELSSVGEKTKLKLTHQGLGSFPANPDFARESFMGGWTELIGTLLKSYVEEKSQIE